MMKKVMVVGGDNATDFDNSVNKWLKRGWEIYGNMVTGRPDKVIGGYAFSILMIKETE
jgi:hypothetical protein